jgi:hypothetical protein
MVISLLNINYPEIEDVVLNIGFPHGSLIRQKAIEGWNNKKSKV